MDKVSVVIPVYGQWKLVKRNIDALMRFDRKNIAEIIIVDDCSPERSPYEFNKELVTIITNEKNLGYTGTVNNGLRKAKSKIIVMLDSDAYPLCPFVQKLIGMYTADTSIGCIGFGTVDDKGNDTGNYQYEPSIGGLIAGQQLESKLGFLRFWRNKNKLPYSCAVSFTRECIEALDYFDGKTFPILDADNDICMRVHRSNWKLVFTKEIIIGHTGGNSYKINYKRVLLFHESRWKLLKKYRLIAFPALAKALMKGRVGVEYIIFKVLTMIKAGGSGNEEKMKGRKMLLKEIDSYK